MPVTQIKIKKKKDGKAHKNKDHSNIRFYGIEENLIPGHLIEILFDQLQIDLITYVKTKHPGYEYGKCYYGAKTNTIYLTTVYQGSGWRGSPTEFDTYGEVWKKINDIIIPENVYVQFVNDHGGVEKGYNIYKVPNIKMNFEF